MDITSGGNTLALITATTALALGIWDRVNTRRHGKDNAEASFRNDLLERLGQVEKEKQDLQDKYDKLMARCFEQGATLTLYKNCQKPDCPFKVHLIVSKSEGD